MSISKKHVHRYISKNNARHFSFNSLALSEIVKAEPKTGPNVSEAKPLVTPTNSSVAPQMSVSKEPSPDLVSNPDVAIPETRSKEFKDLRDFSVNFQVEWKHRKLSNSSLIYSCCSHYSKVFHYYSIFVVFLSFQKKKRNHQRWKKLQKRKKRLQMKQQIKKRRMKVGLNLSFFVQNQWCLNRRLCFIFF